MNFDVNGIQSIIFLFEFSSAKQMESACKSISSSGIPSELSVKNLDKGRFRLGITRTIDLDNDAVDFHKNLLLEDVQGFGATFVSIKLHKVVSNGRIFNKKLSLFSKLIGWLFVDTSKEGGKRYAPPYWRVIVILIVMVVLNTVNLLSKG